MAWPSEPSCGASNSKNSLAMVKLSNKTLQRLADTSLEDKDLQGTIKHYLHQEHGGQQSVQVIIDGQRFKA